MAGTPEGGQKARETNLKKDPNFYSKMGQNSWKNPLRDRETGFALLPKEKRIALGRKGGKKTKDEYKTKKTVELNEETAKELKKAYPHI